MEVRSTDHAADEVLAAIATPEPASGVPQVSPQAAREPVAAGDGEQRGAAQHLPRPVINGGLAHTTRPDPARTSK